MSEDHKDLVKFLSKVEQTAEDILTDKERILDLNRKSNALREAKRALEKQMKTTSEDSKTYICVGNMFFKVSNKKAHDTVEKDQKVVEDEIKNLRNNLRPKVENLRNLEGQPEIPGFNLNPLSKDELAAIGQLLPHT